MVVPTRHHALGQLYVSAVQTAKKSVQKALGLKALLF
jgi:hypothetical protein